MTEKAPPSQVKCPKCKGHRRVLSIRYFGTKGKLYAHKCGVCHGTGVVKA